MARIWAIGKDVENMLTSEMNPLRQFDVPQLLQAYERAIDENIISSITDLTGSILYVNEKFCQISKYSANELIGRDHRIINSGLHDKEFFRSLWSTIVRGDVWHGEVQNKAKDGSLYWVDTVIVPIKDAFGNNSHYFSLRTLITRRKELEKKREAQMKSLEALLVMTSHSVKGPLAVCLKQMERLDPSRSMGNGELEDIADKLKTSMAQLSTSSNELSAFIRDMQA